MSQYHSHIAKGSMKEAHNTDDRQERAQICKRETQEVKVASNATSIMGKLAQMKAALAARDAEIASNQTTVQ